MRLLFKCTGLLLPLALFAGAGIAQTAGDAPQIIWRIGKFDHSSAEFMQGRPTRQPVVYMIGKTTPKANWPAFQPGASNGEAGFRIHPYTIQFDMAEAPKGLYVLKVGFVESGRGRLSILEAEINGQSGLAYQRPQWQNVPGDKNWKDLVEVELPTRSLKRGENRLTLTAIDKPATRDDYSNPGLTYDAIELEHYPLRKFDSSAIGIQAQPTIFYQQKGDRLVELVDVYVDHNFSGRQGQVTITSGGAKTLASFDLNHDFGTKEIELAVPEFPSPIGVKVSVKIGRHRRELAVTLHPAKKWTLYVVPNEHLDVGYTDYQAKVAELQSRVLDEAMRMIHNHPDFRYSPDGFWVFQQFFAGRSETDRKRLLQAVRAHKIIVPAQYANVLTEFPGVETLIRSLYPSFRFDQKSGADFDYANITDVPSYTWSYPSILAAAGLKYLVAGSDQTRGPILLHSHLEEESPFWWQGPDGSKVLMWYSDSYGQVGFIFGLPPEVEVGRAALPLFLQIYSTPYYKLSSAILFGAQWENSDLYPQQATIADEWNKRFAFPKIIYTGFANALREVAQQAGSSIPTYKGDGGPYWEDGIYSDTHFAIMERESEQRAPSAEKMATISSIVNSRVHPETNALREMWRNMVLFDEHTWGAAGSISTPHSQETTGQIAVKDAFATNANHELNYVLKRGMAAIADRIDQPAGSVVVFNPLNWQRNGFVTFDLPKGFDLIDETTGKAVAYQVLSDRHGYQRIRFVAQDVPSVGYKCYKLELANSKPSEPVVSTGLTIQNSYYRVVLDPESGAVKSIFDKQLGKELVNTSSPYHFDQYLYVTGGNTPPRNRLIYSDPDLPLPKLTIHRAGAGHVLSVETVPFGTIARLESSDTNTPRIETDVILFNSQKKIEFINHVQKRKNYKKEGVYFAFPLAMDQPEFRYDIQNGVVNPAQDLLPGADRAWFSLQHWVAANEGGVTAALIPVDAELFTLGDIFRGKWPLHLGQRRGTIFSYVMNNYWFTNYVAAQGGNYTFRYIFTSGSHLAAGELTRLGWEEMTPLEVDSIIPNDKERGIQRPQPLNADAASFLQVSAPDVVLVDWKDAEDGHGAILRFLELGGTRGQVRVTIPILDVQKAWLCNAMEQDEEPLTTSAHELSFPVKPFEIVTVRVAGASAVE